MMCDSVNVVCHLRRSCVAADRIFRYLEKYKYVSLSPSLNALLLSVAAGMVLFHRDQQPQMLLNFLFKLRSTS